VVLCLRDPIPIILEELNTCGVRADECSEVNEGGDFMGLLEMDDCGPLVEVIEDSFTELTSNVFCLL
jgi:hypothetical protein